jgi:hypothetical protein
MCVSGWCDDSAGVPNKELIMKIMKAAMLIIARDWDRVRIIVPLLSLLIFYIWLSFWGMAKTVEIREREALDGRYAGLEAISYVEDGE